MPLQPLTDHQVRLIFGLKLKQLRTKKNYSLLGLSKISGLSKSYLNEIEKGKKYPKTDKIVALAEVLDTTYDELVSMKLSGGMAPMADIIRNGVLKEIPLELFGIDEGQLLDIVSSAPKKVTAFIGTVFDIARSYNLTKENFYLSALRSYQESSFNYFKDIEDEVVVFTKRHQIQLEQSISAQELSDILIEEYGYTIEWNGLNQFDDVDQIRSVFNPKAKTLLISKKVKESQRAFILAKELAYCHLGITERPLTFSWIKFNGFEDVLNNFRASYFAGSLLISENRLITEMAEVFQAKTWQPKKLHTIMKGHRQSAETFFQRLTNVLSEHFKLKKLFFLRLERHVDNTNIHMTKELHLSKSHNPHAIQSEEHYCRRWVSCDILLNPDKYQFYDGVGYGAQISVYPETGEKYLVLTVSDKDPFNDKKLRSISIGVELDGRQDKVLNFVESGKLVTKETNFTCERCGFLNCKERAGKPKLFEAKEKAKAVEEKVEELIKTFDS